MISLLIHAFITRKFITIFVWWKCTCFSRKRIVKEVELPLFSITRSICDWKIQLRDIQLHFYATQALGRNPCAELERVLPGSPINFLRANSRFRVLVEVDDEVAISHQRRQAHALLLYLRAYQHFQREEMFIVCLRQVTVHELRQAVTQFKTNNLIVLLYNVSNVSDDEFRKHYICYRKRYSTLCPLGPEHSVIWHAIVCNDASPSHCSFSLVAM